MLHVSTHFLPFASTRKNPFQSYRPLEQQGNPKSFLLHLLRSASRHYYWSSNDSYDNTYSIHGYIFPYNPCSSVTLSGKVISCTVCIVAVASHWPFSMPSLYTQPLLQLLIVTTHGSMLSVLLPTLSPYVLKLHKLGDSFNSVWMSR